MKKIFVFAAAVASLFTLSCDKYDKYEEDVIIDWAPIVMHIYLGDYSGNDLLDQNSETAVDLSNLVVRYEGEEYPLGETLLSKGEPTVGTMAYLARFGFISLERDAEGKVYLRIGEWDAMNRWQDCSLEVDWGFATDVLSFSNDYTYNPKHRNNGDKNWGYTFHRTAYLNGELVYDGSSRVLVYHIDLDAPIVDWMPIEMIVYARDEEGNNLLNKNTEGHFDAEQIVVRYEGKEYRVKNVDTLYLPPMDTSVFIYYDNNNELLLWIGEWDAFLQCENCSLEIDWGNGTTDVLSFSSDYTYDPKYRFDSDKNWGYTFHRTAYLNGEQIYEGSSATLKYELVK